MWEIPIFVNLQIHLLVEKLKTYPVHKMAMTQPLLGLGVPIKHKCTMDTPPKAYEKLFGVLVGHICVRKGEN